MATEEVVVVVVVVVVAVVVLVVAGRGHSHREQDEDGYGSLEGTDSIPSRGYVQPAGLRHRW